MIPVMVAGAGKIGRLIACLLSDTGDYKIYLADQTFNGPETQRLLREMPELERLVLDVQAPEALLAALKKHQVIALISSLPYFLNPPVAFAAKAAGTHYFD